MLIIVVKQKNHVMIRDVYNIDDVSNEPITTFINSSDLRRKDFNVTPTVLRIKQFRYVSSVYFHRR